MAQAKQSLQASRGFPVHRLKKSNIKGAMGERIGKTSNIRDVENFMKGMQAYTEGLLRTTYGWEFRNDMMGRNGILEAKQMLEDPNTKVLVNRMIENATGNHTRAYEKVINNYTRRLFGERGLDKLASAFRFRGTKPQEIASAKQTQNARQMRDTNFSEEQVSIIDREVDKIFPEFRKFFNASAVSEIGRAHV